MPQITKSTASVSCPLAQQMHQDYTLPWCAILKSNGIYIFTQTLHSINTLGKNAVSFTETDNICPNKTKLVSGSRTIIDYMFLFCSNIYAILIYLECVCKVFLKYWVSFRLNKFDFLKTQVKDVGHDVTKSRNCPAQSKFRLINDCILSPSGQYLFSFVGIVNFYHCYTPYFEILLKPLQAFLKQYYLKNASYGMDPTNYHAVFWT